LREPREPLLGLLPVRRGGRQHEFLRLALELAAPLLQGLLPDRYALTEKKVERDELGEDLRRELPDPALGRMEAHLQCVEVHLTFLLDHDLADQPPARGHTRL